jgi:hypothetical protein
MRKASLGIVYLFIPNSWKSSENLFLSNITGLEMSISTQIEPDEALSDDPHKV